MVLIITKLIIVINMKNENNDDNDDILMMKITLLMIMMMVISIMKIQLITDRSWHSLKERYRKRIVPNLHIYQRFGLSKTMLQRFKSKKYVQSAEGEEVKVEERGRDGGERKR